MNRKKGLFLAALPIWLLPAAYIFIGYYRRVLSRYIMPCPVRFFLGVQCPGCGGTHCIYSLAEGHILEALQYNAIYFFGVLALILVWAQETIRAFGKPVKLLPDSPVFWWSVGGAAAVYSVVRNLV